MFADGIAKIENNIGKNNFESESVFQHDKCVHKSINTTFISNIMAISCNKLMEQLIEEIIHR